MSLNLEEKTMKGKFHFDAVCIYDTENESPTAKMLVFTKFESIYANAFQTSAHPYR